MTDRRGDEVVTTGAPVADADHDSSALRRARRRAGGLSLLLLSAAVALAVPLLDDPRRPWFQRADRAAFEWFRDHRSPPLVRIAEWLDVLGSTVVTVPLRAVAIVVLVARRRWTQTTIFVVALVTSELCIGPLKALVDRPRPPDPAVEISAASFPSGHAIATAVTAFGLVIAFLPRGRRRIHWGIGSTLLAGSMAWSRVYLGAHWMTDTIAGVCIGAGLAIGTEALLEGGRTVVAHHECSAGDAVPAGPVP